MLIDFAHLVVFALLLLHIPAGAAASVGDDPSQMPRSGRQMLLEPSVLAADIGSLASEARALEAAGFSWVHVDVCDGSRECCRALSSLGPASIAAIRKAAPSLSIDVHLYVLDPEEHVGAMASAGADRITFQIETLGDGGYERAHALATRINALGCHAGVCMAPATPVEAVDELCRNGDVDLVDVLAVLPGVHDTVSRCLHVSPYISHTNRCRALHTPHCTSHMPPSCTSRRRKGSAARAFRPTGLRHSTRCGSCGGAIRAFPTRWSTVGWMGRAG